MTTNNLSTFEEKMEIGALPEGWEVVQIGSITKEHKQGFYTDENYSDDGINLVRITDLQNPGISYSSMPKIKIDENTFKQFKVEVGDFLIARSGAIGRYGIVENSIPCVFASYIIRFRFDKSRVDNLYFGKLFESFYISNELRKITQGATNKNINAQNIKKIQIPLPPLPEQRRIAEVLGTVDSAIQKVGGAIESTERLKKGLMQRLLTRGIGHERFKESEVGKVPEEWEVVRLGDALELCQYGLSVKMDETGKYPIIKMDDFVNGVVVPDKVKYIDLDDKTFKNFKLEKGDILFNRTNSYELVGRTGIFLLRGDYVFASYLIRLRPKKETVDSQFLTFYMAFSNDRIRQQLATRAVHQANINATNLQNYNIPLPPLPEQRRIAEILSAVDRKLEIERRRKEKLERVKKGLMNELLTGRKRVKV